MYRGLYLFFVLLMTWACSKEPLNTEGMVHIPAGEFIMGTDDGFPYEGPTHPVRLDSFWMDETEVTNEKPRTSPRRNRSAMQASSLPSRRGGRW